MGPDDTHLEGGSMDDLPNFGLANTITGFATLFSGMTCLALSR